MDDQDKANSWLQVGREGRAFYPFAPSVDQIDIKDIALSLSKMCRYNGHCWGMFSVAKHSVVGAKCIFQQDIFGLNYSEREDLAKEFLLHDASEAYLGDLISPIKAFSPNYKITEGVVEKVISKKFNLPYPLSPNVKLMDRIMLAWEKRDIIPNGPFWSDLVDITDYRLPLLPSSKSWGEDYDEFMGLYHEIF